MLPARRLYPRKVFPKVLHHMVFIQKTGDLLPNIFSQPQKIAQGGDYIQNSLTFQHHST